MVEYTIRRATLDDVIALSDIGKDTFVETFAHLYKAEDLSDYLNEAHSVNAYKDYLSNPDIACWVCIANEIVSGYLITGPNSLTLPEETSILGPQRCGEVKRFYLKQSMQGTGAAQSLIALGLEWFTAQEYEIVTLSVYEDNHRAQAFYARYGFTKIGEHHFPVGRHLDTDYIFWNGGDINRTK